MQVPPKRITFEEARTNVNLRQAYIEQLVQEEFGEEAYKYADISYDHDRTQARKTAHDDLTRLFEEPRYAETTRRRLEGLPSILKDHGGLRVLGKDSDILEYINKKMKSNEFKHLKRSSRVKSVVDFLQSAAGLEDFIAYLKEEHIKKKERDIEDDWGINIGYQYEFGANKKTKIYIFRNLFEPYEFIYQGKSHILHPTEESIKSTLHHEVFHARDYFHGIKLNDNLVIDKSNFSNVDTSVLTFVQESSAYLKQLEFTRQFNKDSADFFERYHSSYLRTATFIRDYLLYYWIPLAKKWMAPGKEYPKKSITERVFEYQFREVMKVYDEVTTATIGLVRAKRA